MLELDRLHIYPIVPIADRPDSENSQLWGQLRVLPIVYEQAKSGDFIMNTIILRWQWAITPIGYENGNRIYQLDKR